MQLRLEADTSIELLDNLLRYHEAQANTLGVHLLRVLHKAEQLEEFFLIFFCNSDTCILHRNLDEFFMLSVLDYLHSYDHAALLSEL
jgi:hypothetical protein